MTEVTTRQVDGNGHTPETRHIEGSDGIGYDVPASMAYRGVPIAAPGPCPHARSFSKVTGEYAIELGYDAFEELMDAVFDVWDFVDTKALRDRKLPPEPGTLAATIVVTDETIGDAFEALVGRIAAMQDWTGWGGVAGIYTGAGGLDT